MDYIIADPCVIPPDQEDCYVEKIVYLPDTYQVNDAKRRIADRDTDAIGGDVPEKGFVFCCFNNNYKITPEVFDVWMRLLGRSAAASCGCWTTTRTLRAICGMRQNGAVRSNPLGIRPAFELAGTPRASSAGRFISRYLALQRAYHRQRCAVGGTAYAHLPRDYVSRTGCCKPAQRHRSAGIDYALASRLRIIGGAIGS